MIKGPVCGWTFEESAWRRGAQSIAGLDEAGRGPLFGPVVAAAVILPQACPLQGLHGLQGLQGLTDSKKLSEKKRNQLDREIRACSLAWAVAVVDAETIDRINIRRASLQAMRRAVEQLGVTPDFLLPDFLLIDGRDTIDWPCPQQAIVGGDAQSVSIAAASVLAKVHRDRLLVELDRDFPGYGLARHKGYGCPEHLAALERLGPTPLHRRSFQPVARMLLPFH